MALQNFEYEHINAVSEWKSSCALLEQQIADLKVTKNELEQTVADEREKSEMSLKAANDDSQNLATKVLDLEKTNSNYISEIQAISKELERESEVRSYHG